jgi:hypothetical protein
MDYPKVKLFFKLQIDPFDQIKTGLQVVINRVNRENRPAKSWLRKDMSQLEKIRDDSYLITRPLTFW